MSKHNIELIQDTSSILVDVLRNADYDGRIVGDYEVKDVLVLAVIEDEGPGYPLFFASSPHTLVTDSINMAIRGNDSLMRLFCQLLADDNPKDDNNVK